MLLCVVGTDSAEIIGNNYFSVHSGGLPRRNPDLVDSVDSMASTGGSCSAASGEQRKKVKIMLQSRYNSASDLHTQLLMNHKVTCDSKDKVWKRPSSPARLVERRAVNAPPDRDKVPKLEYDVVSANIRDSGYSGRAFEHILMGSLLLIIAEMTLYIFVANVFFGAFYYFSGGCCGGDGDFWDDFNFAFQTFTTVGYGTLSPEGVSANIIVFFQGIHNLVITTIFAGVVFTKFVRPRWKFVFADVVPIHNVRGTPTLFIRFGNVDGAFNTLVNVAATLYYSYYVLDNTGKAWFRRTEVLKLVCDMRFEVRGVWSIQHNIDEDSPLYMKTVDDLRKIQATMHMSVTGIDPVTEESVCKTKGYLPFDILFGYKYEDQISVDGRNVIFDYGKLSSVVPAPVSYPNKPRFLFECAQMSEELRKSEDKNTSDGGDDKKSTTCPKAFSSDPIGPEMGNYEVGSDEPPFLQKWKGQAAANPNEEEMRPVAKDGMSSTYGTMEERSVGRSVK